MNVIIVAGSKHGSTRAIAEVVGHELRNSGLEVSIVDADADAISLDGYDAAVIGSAVYVGRWMRGARAFLQANRASLQSMPVWLFSSGPLRDGPEQPDDLADVRAFADDVHARDHRVFAGKLDRADLSLAERAAVRIVHAPYGDMREWDEIRAWAQSIVAALIAPLSATAAPAAVTARS
jgi:menaquinone-dependent protoporphyrinogen oxidase